MTRADAQARMLKLFASAGPLPPIAERVTGERRAIWQGMSALMPDGMPEFIDKMPTWLAAFMIGMTIDRFKAPATTAGVDNQLESQFKKAAKKVTAIEEPDGVFARMNKIPPSAQSDMLVNTLDAAAKPRNPRQRLALIHDWAKGKPLTGFSESLAGLSFAADLEETLLKSRNGAWVDVITRRMDQPGTTLVAVGTAHLWGAGSVIDLLAKTGVAAVRVSPTTAARPRANFLPAPVKWKECDDYLLGRKTPQSGVE